MVVFGIWGLGKLFENGYGSYDYCFVIRYLKIEPQTANANTKFHDLTICKINYF